MVSFRPSPTPFQSSNVSALRAQFEARAGGQQEVYLTRGQASTKSAHKTDQLNQAATPQSGNPAYVKTAENVYNKATKPFLTAHSGSNYEEKYVVTQSIKSTLPQQVMHESEAIETTVQWKFPYSEHEHLHIYEHEAPVNLQIHIYEHEAVTLQMPEVKPDVDLVNIGSTDPTEAENEYQPVAASTANQALEEEVTDAAAPAPEAAVPDEHWSATLSQGLKSEKPDGKAMQIAIEKMLTEIQTKAAINKGVISKFDLEEASGARDLMGMLKETKAPWLDEGLRETISDMHEVMSGAIIETEKRVLLDDVGEAGRFDGIPKPYDNIGTSILNYARQRDQLSNHLSKLYSERGKAQISNDETREMLQKIDEISLTLHSIVNLGQEGHFDTLHAQWDKLFQSNEASANKDPNIQVVILRLVAIMNTVKSLNAAKALFEPAFKKLSNDIRRFEEYGLDKSNPKEYKQLTDIYNELAVLVVKDGKIKAPAILGAQNWVSIHIDTSPNGLAQEISNKMTKTFQTSWYLKESNIDVNELHHVLDLFKTASTDNSENLDKLKDLATQFKSIIEEAHIHLGSVKQGDSIENLTEGQRQALTKMVLSLVKLMVSANTLSTAIPEGYRFQIAHMNISRGLVSWPKTFIKQMATAPGFEPWFKSLFEQLPELKGLKPEMFLKDEPFPPSG